MVVDVLFFSDITTSFKLVSFRFCDKLIYIYVFPNLSTTTRTIFHVEVSV